MDDEYEKKEINMKQLVVRLIIVAAIYALIIYFVVLPVINSTNQMLYQLATNQTYAEQVANSLNQTFNSSNSSSNQITNCLLLFDFILLIMNMAILIAAMSRR